jgi:hypothetical protein
LKFFVQAVVCVLGASATAWAIAAQQPTFDASWHKHEVNFTYMDFTSNYSCDGLEDKLKLLLRLAGARPDGDVRVPCTSPVGSPQRSSMVLLTFHTLAPAAAADANAATTGLWKDVVWRAGSPRELDAGDCELVDQFARRILPLFTTRNVENRMTCTPHQVNPSGFDLRFTVLASAPISKSGLTDQSR